MKLGYKVSQIYELERFGFKFNYINNTYVKPISPQVNVRGFDESYYSSYLVVEEATGEVSINFNYGFSNEDKPFQELYASAKIPLADIFELLEAGIITKYY